MPLEIQVLWEFLPEIVTSFLDAKDRNKQYNQLLNAGLAREAIVEIFNNLATVTGKTITISGTPGAAALTQAERDIALNKGWTITG
jgi:hypothetical protein